MLRGKTFQESQRVGSTRRAGVLRHVGPIYPKSQSPEIDALLLPPLFFLLNHSVALPILTRVTPNLYEIISFYTVIVHHLVYICTHVIRRKIFFIILNLFPLVYSWRTSVFHWRQMSMHHEISFFFYDKF